MQALGLGGYKTLDAFVANKLSRFQEENASFALLFDLLFSEQENILYERSAGYRIETVTYGQAKKETLALAAAVQNALPDAAPNAVVGLAMENSLSWIETFWAILCAGFCPLLINLRLPRETVEQALGDMKAVAVISDGRSYGVQTIPFASLTPTDAGFAPRRFGDELWLMSSGTSEHIKLCAYSAKEFAYQIRDSYHIMHQCAALKKHYNGRLKLLTLLPFYHIFGLVAVYIWFAFFSRTFVHLENLEPRTILNTIKRHQVTHLFAVPLFWESAYRSAMRSVRARGEEERLAKGLCIARKIGDVPLVGPLFIRKAFAPVREQIFGQSISFMISGGSMISHDALEFFNLIGYRLANGYGMTEIGIASVELSPRLRVRCDGSVGKPVAGVQYAINEQGELTVRSKSRARTILCGGKQAEQAEWFNTHDLAACERGRYRLLGRRDDVVIAADGENLNPALIEPAFDGEDVNGAALLGIPGGDGTEPVLLVSVPRTLTADRFDAVEARVRRTAETTGLSQSLKRIVFVTDPLLDEQEVKLNHARLARKLAQGAFCVVTGEQFSDTLAREDDPRLARVRELFAFALNKEADAVRDNTDFFLDEGGTSLDYFALISTLQEEYALVFPMEEGKSLRTVADLFRFIREDGHGDQTV